VQLFLFYELLTKKK